MQLILKRTTSWGVGFCKLVFEGVILARVQVQTKGPFISLNDVKFIEMEDMKEVWKRTVFQNEHHKPANSPHVLSESYDFMSLY